MPNSDRLRQRMSQLIGRLYTRIPALARRWGQHFDALSFAEVPLTPFRKPLRDCRVALITTGGVHLHAQPPYNMADSRGDPSYRIIPAGTLFSDLTITHNYYDHSWISSSRASCAQTVSAGASMQTDAKSLIIKTSFSGAAITGVDHCGICENYHDLNH